VVPVVQGHPIAIYEDDFFDPDLVWTVGQVIATGTVTPSGLRWPHVDGTRNGKPFRYFTQLPSLRRDRVAACSISPAYTISKGPGPYPPVWGSYTVAAVGDTFYKLPFDYGFQPATGLLNIDDPFVNARHPEWQAYAFDLVAPYLALLRAARGGEVVDVVESDPYNVADAPEGWPGIGNYVWIQHEDGTIGIYFHIAHQQALVAVGQKLRRGDPVALCGETGNASEPHVHFEVINPDQSKRRIRFQAIVNSTIDNCFLPRSFHVFQSTNTAP
jgi:hypothetical protein